MENIENQTRYEQNESPAYKHLTVYRVRHGETAYHEHTGTGEKQIDYDLTEEGQENILRSAEAIASELDPDRDIVLIGTSARTRAHNSANIIREYLSEEGFDVRYDDDRSIREWIQGADLIDERGDVIPPNTPEHAEIFTDLNAMPDMNERREHGELANLEHPESVNKRTRDHMALLIRFAKHAQFPENKRLVVVQTEHEETLDQLISEASGGNRKTATGTGVRKGEVLRLDIPRERDADEREVEIPIHSINGSEEDSSPSTIKFDYLSRDFVD